MGHGSCHFRPLVATTKTTGNSDDFRICVIVDVASRNHTFGIFLAYFWLSREKIGVEAAYCCRELGDVFQVNSRVG
jgi:hypothetical protein